MASTTTELKVQALYVGYLGRAAELAGRDFWADAIEGGSVTYQQVASQFAQSPEFQSLYSGLTTPQLIDAVYRNVLGRPSDPDGLQFWVDQVQSGNVPADLVVLYMIEGMSATDRVRFDTRVQDGNDYTEAHPNDYVLEDAQAAVGLLNELVATVDGQQATSVDEGQTVQFQFSTIDFFPGSTLNYSITGVSAADVVGGQLSGQVTLDVMNKAIVSVTLTADALTEGAETLSLSLGGLNSAITVNDTSVTPPPPPATYAISAAQAGYVEGDTARFDIVTTNVAAGTQLSYVISGKGIDADDVAGGVLKGNTVVDAFGNAAINVTLLEDQVTEGTEVMTVSLIVGGTPSASVTVSDTSKSPGYSLTADQAKVVEGDAATFTLETQNVAAGTTVTYTIGGDVNAADIGGPLTGTATVQADGKAYISVPTVSDGILEGLEALKVTVSTPGGLQIDASTVLSDSPTYRLTAGQDGTATQPVQAEEFDGSQELTALGLVNTLGDTDHLQGVGPDAVLNAVIGNADGIKLVTPSMTNVDTVNVEFANSLPFPVALSFEDTTGTSEVNATRISGGQGALVLDMNKEVTSLSATNTVAAVPFLIFDYRDGEAPTTVDLALKNVTVTDLYIGQGVMPGFNVGTGVETLNLTSDGINTVGTNTGNGLDSAVKTLSLTVNSSSLTINGVTEAALATINATGAGNLTLAEVGSAAGFQLQAGSMTGNVKAWIDNAAAQGNSVFNTGEGSDWLNTKGDLGGDINTDGGSDTVGIGGHILGSGSVNLGGAGDTVTVGGDMKGGAEIRGGDGGDSISVTGNVEGDNFTTIPDAGIFGEDGGDSIFVGGVVSGSVDGGNDGDYIQINGGVAAAGSVTGGQGFDSIYVYNNVAGSVSGGTEGDYIYIGGNVSGSVQGDGGDDQIYIAGNVTGSVGGGADSDQMYVGNGITNGSVTGGSGMDYLVVDGPITSGGSSAVDMGDDDDVFWQRVSAGTAVTQNGNGVPAVQGGAPSASDTAVFANTGNGVVTVTGGAGTGDAVTGFETIQLFNQASGTIVADFGDIGGTPRVDLLSVDGNSSTTTLTGLDGEALFLTGAIAQGGNLPGWGAGSFDGFVGASPVTNTVNLNVAGSGGMLKATIESLQQFVVNLDDTTSGYSDLALDITNTTRDQTVNFDAANDDFTGTTTVTGSAAGNTISLNEIDSQTIMAQIAADVSIVAGARADDGAIFALDRFITTGSGDDVVDYRKAYLDGGNGVTTLGDEIKLGLGVNKLIIGNSTDVTPDRDEAFEGVKGATILAVDGNSKIFLGDDAYAAGIKVLETMPGANVTAETGLGFGGFELQVNLGLESTLTLQNEPAANNDLDLRVTLDETPTGSGQGTPSDDDATLILNPAGTGSVGLKVKIDDDTPTWIGTKAVTDANGWSELSLKVDAASGIDQIKLIDNNIDINDNGVNDQPFDPDFDNANVVVVLNDSWALNALTVDAGGIDDFDNNTATGAVVIDGSDEKSADLTLRGSANDNVLVGGKGANILIASGGDDILIGGDLADTLTGFGGDDILIGNGGDDKLNAGLGDDYLIGGAGSDDLTGGGGSDVFDYLNGKDSSPGASTLDLIRDFDFKVDALSVSNAISLVGTVIIEDNIGAANPGNLFTFLESRSEVQTAFALAGSNALFVTVMSPNFTDGDVSVMLIENGTLPGDLKTFDSKDIMIQFDDDGSYTNLGFFSLANFGPFGDGTPVTAPAITAWEEDTNPNFPGDSLTYDNDLLFSGTAAANASVTLFVDADGDSFLDWDELSWTTGADGGGLWSVQTGELPDGKWDFRALQEIEGANGGTFISPVSKAEVVEIDTVAPTVTLTVVDDKLTSGETTAILIKFSERVDENTIDFGDLDASGANGTLDPLSFSQVTPSLWTVTFTPTAAIEDYTNVISFTGAYTDKAGNDGLPGTSGNFIIDSIAPTVAVTLNDYAIKIGDAVTVTFDFSEEVTGFGLLDINLADANGKVSGLTQDLGDPTIYTATFTPFTVEDLTNTISVDNLSYKDLAGNDGAGATSPNYEIDTIAPTVIVTIDDDFLTIGETATLTYTFSEDVTGFDASDITAETGTLSTFTVVNAFTYTALFTPTPLEQDLTAVATVIDQSYTDLRRPTSAATARWTTRSIRGSRRMSPAQATTRVTTSSS